MITLVAAKDKIILPLDVADAEAACRLVKAVSKSVAFYKIGLELFTRCGPTILSQVRAAAEEEGVSCRIFLDLKFHDIPNTVAQAVRAAIPGSGDMLTVHLSGGGAMLRAAVAQAPAELLLLGVTVLTSSDAGTLRETGVTDDPKSQVLRLADLAVANGLRGVVASPMEITALRERHGARLTIVTPGVRPAWLAGGQDDQRRVLTPGEAVRAGADYLVIGRPISAAPEPGDAARRIAEEIAGNLPSAA